jgi:putative ABC transport system permease protein
MNLSFYLALKNLTANKKLFLLVVGILAFSFINLSFFNSLNNGIRDVTNSKLVDYTYADLNVLPQDDEIYIYDTTDTLNKIQRLSFVKAATQRLSFQGSISYEDKSFNPTFLGIDVDNEALVSSLHTAVEQGSYLGRESTNEIILGDEIVGNLDGSKGTTGFKTIDAGVGDDIKIYFKDGKSQEFRVSGIMDTLFWVPDFYALVNIRYIQEILNLSQETSSEILIKLDEGIDKDYAKIELINLGLSGQVKDSLNELSLAETILESQRVTTLLANIIGVFSTFVVIFIIIYINVNQKKKQLSLLKAVGIQERTIIKSYLYLSFFYAIAGIIFGIIGLTIIILILKSNPIKLPMGYFYPQFTIIELLYSSSIILTSALIGGFVASYNTIKTNIVEVLRGIK